ncbi:MAG: L-seryl-tRNA(Sec) selenium transferase, partial [Planctomycetota bacterium]
LREVGTTNKTHPHDYEQAIGEETAVLMRVHPSNFVVVGFSSAVSLPELVRIGRKHNLPVIDDIGSGAMFPLDEFGAVGEPVARESIEAGADLVLFSGDKLLGGPQCGIIVGRRHLIDRIAKHPMMRAMRVDKTTLAGLAATLRLHRDPQRAQASIPLLQLLTTSVENLQNRAERLAPQLEACDAVESAVAKPEEAFLGGGSVPTQKLETWCVAITPARHSADRLAAGLRKGTPAVVGRVQHDQLLLDLRSVPPRDDQALVNAVRGLSPSD